MVGDDKKKAATKKSASKIGHDPLAWINEPDAVEKDVTAEQMYSDANNSGQAVESPSAQQADSPDMPVLNLPVYFGIAQSSGVCAEMQKLLASGCKSVEISGAEVESIDTAAVQLLMAFNKQAMATGVEVYWSGCSQKITEVRNLLGVNI